MYTLEYYLVAYCSPTLANLKTAGLFGYSYESLTDLFDEVRLVNQSLEKKNIRLEVLKLDQKRALIYCYRPHRLKKDLACANVDSFLTKFDYPLSHLDDKLSYLRKRLREQTTFPHEIGVFLGYPLCDVIGFIENEGHNYKCCCDWKVYGDANFCNNLFYAFKLCKEQNLRSWQQGTSILQLAI